jgi:hypothetical protein
MPNPRGLRRFLPGRNVRTRSAAELVTGQDSMRNRARAAAVISESIGIPPHLSLPPFPSPALCVCHDQQPPGRIENGTKR